MTVLAAGAFFYRGMARWSFGLDNPNKAAALLALILLLLVAAALRARRRAAGWCWGLLATIAGLGLVHTFSRGGIVAFLAGMAVLLVGERKNLLAGRRWLPVAMAACVMAVAAVWTGFAGRLAHSLPGDDASAGNRLAVWRNAPSMMVDAPGGWGFGASGDAFMGWYQPLDRTERYRTLVNSHLTWLVECGWPGRLCYMGFWLLVVGMGLVRLKVRGDPLPLALWLAFATAASFSSVAEDWRVCALPLATLPPLLHTACTRAATAARRPVAVATLPTSLLLLGGLAILGAACRPSGVPPIRRSPDGTRLILGKGRPSTWAVCDPETMGGAAFGRRLRAFAQAPEGRDRAFGLARTLEAVPPDVRRLALCGRAGDEDPAILDRFPALADVRILSPSRPEKWLAARSARPGLRVFCGAFAAACPPEDAEGLTVVPGAADYLPDWPRLAFGD